MDASFDWLAHAAFTGLLIWIAFTVGHARGVSAQKKHVANGGDKPNRELPPTPVPEAPAPDHPEPPVALGVRFQFMGAWMVCVSHQLPGLIPHTRSPFPGIHAIYRDMHGVLRDAHIPPHGYDALKLELMRNAPVDIMRS